MIRATERIPMRTGCALALAFAFLCSARQCLALASVQATNNTHINDFTQSTFIIIYANAGDM